jgi:hypothetical protein
VRFCFLASRLQVDDLFNGLGTAQDLLSSFFEFESADMAGPYDAFVVNYVAADDFSHHGQIEVADFRIAFGQIVKHAIDRLDGRPFLFCRVDRPRLIA